MRKSINLNESWIFINENITIEEVLIANGQKIDLPHTWNGIDGQDGGNDYVRNSFWFKKIFKKNIIAKNDLVFIEFKGVNASADVYLNNTHVGHHDGGYSTFRFEVTNLLKAENLLAVKVDNSINDKVYPQKADFTFYGGIYRDVNLISVPKNHFDLLHYGSKGVKVKATANKKQGELEIESYIIGNGKVFAKLLNKNNKVVYEGEVIDKIIIDNVHLWNGLEDPYLYHLDVMLKNDDQIDDIASFDIGFRYFDMDPNEGFFLNGEKYPLRGVCRHQDRPQIGNALHKEHHEEDIEIIKSVGANTIRLAHYQHDDYFYDLCDKHGFVVWAEIPYISKHMTNANDNARNQMKELIIQQYHHPSIVTWGISNEITISRAGNDCLLFHEEMNEICHTLDDTRKTVIANYMPARIKNKLNRIPDVVSYNLYFGWYFPFTWLSGWKLDRYHKLFPKEIIGLSEYGAEATIKIHSKRPRRGDNTEEYQAIYHERMLKIIEKRDYLWATHLWNMFDFAADARNQGGNPGMNQKGLVTFDRKVRKDSFYLYKAYWSNEPFIHVCGKHFVNRTGKSTTVKVYSNQPQVSLYNNDKLIATLTSDKVFVFQVPLEEKNLIVAKTAKLEDNSEIIKVSKKDKSYTLRKTKNKSWEQ